MLTIREMLKQIREREFSSFSTFLLPVPSPKIPHNMKHQEFKTSLGNDSPPPDISAALQALWHQAKGDWDAAHHLAQSDKSPTGCWVHAHLHRVEGDKSNAAYWYRLAGKPICKSRLGDEWEEIVKTLIIVQDKK